MNAKSEIMLIDTPSIGMKSRVPRKLMGIPIVTQNASRSSRKMPSTMSTRIRPRYALRIRRSMRSS